MTAPPPRRQIEEPPALFQLRDLAVKQRTNQDSQATPSLHRAIDAVGSETHQAGRKGDLNESGASPRPNNELTLRADTAHSTGAPARAWQPISEINQPADSSTYAHSVGTSGAPVDAFDETPPVEQSGADGWGARVAMIALLVFVVTSAAIAVKGLRKAGQEDLADTEQEYPGDIELVESDQYQAAIEEIEQTIPYETPLPTDDLDIGDVSIDHVAARSHDVEQLVDSYAQAQSDNNQTNDAQHNDKAIETPSTMPNDSQDDISFDHPFFSSAPNELTGPQNSTPDPLNPATMSSDSPTGLENSDIWNTSPEGQNTTTRDRSIVFKEPAASAYEQLPSDQLPGAIDPFPQDAELASNFESGSLAVLAANSSLNGVIPVDNNVTVEPVTVEPIVVNSSNDSKAYRYSRMPLPVTNWADYFAMDDSYNDKAYIASGDSDAERQ